VFEERVMFYGVDGMRLGIYKLTTVSGSLGMEKATESFYWGSKLVKQFDALAVSYEDVVQDRLGSVLARGVTRFKYYPYGEERGSATADDREKFGTYWRDSYTGWDYADQRYYSGAWGRFASVLSVIRLYNLQELWSNGACSLQRLFSRLIQPRSVYWNRWPAPEALHSPWPISAK
jgi:hypothetical protein